MHRPKDFLVLAVFALILFLPTGIIALHKSWKVCVCVYRGKLWSLYMHTQMVRVSWLCFHVPSITEWLLWCGCTHCDAHTHNTQVKTLRLKPGNYDKAVAASRSARFWGTLSCVIGILILLVAVIVGLVIHYSLQ